MKPAPLLLLLPLALASFGLSAMAQQPSSARVWQQSQQTDAARDVTYTHFTLPGKFLTSPQGGVSNGPALVLDCIPAQESHRGKGKLVNANLLAGTPLKIEYVEPEEIHGTSYFRKVTVRYRTDDGKEEVEKWSIVADRSSPPGTDKTSVSIPKDDLKKILHAHSIEITAQDNRGSPVTMKFDIPDPTPVEEICNVD